MPNSKKVHFRQEKVLFMFLVFLLFLQFLTDRNFMTKSSRETREVFNSGPGDDDHASTTYISDSIAGARP
jgi:hypothetical protein